MKNKRTLVISTVVALAVILSVITFFALPRPAESAQRVPLMGHISYDQILAQQNQAVGGSHPTTGHISYDQIQASSAGRDPVIPVTGFSRSYIPGNHLMSPGDEYIPDSQDR